MRNLIFVAFACLAAACTPTANDEQLNISNTNVIVATTPAPSSDCGLASDTLLDEKALFAAETVYNVSADAYIKLNAQFPVERKAQAKAALIQAYDYLKLARTAYAAGDGCTLKQYSDLAQAFGNKAKSFIN